MIYLPVLFVFNLIVKQQTDNTYILFLTPVLCIIPAMLHEIWEETKRNRTEEFWRRVEKSS